ncbi:unnamed protein product [Schistosoma intercalatum]|nr:unnamed protein product [Schistosoma intercalatum]
MLGFVRYVAGAAISYQIFIVFGILPCVISSEALNGLLSSGPSKDNSEKCTLATSHCVPIALHLNRTCLGNHLPYKLTAPIPLGEDVTFYSLEFWTALQSIPTCWDKLQFFLCSVYVPECVVIQTSKFINADSTYSSVTTGNNQSDLNNHSINVTSSQEFFDKNMSADSFPSSSTNFHRIVLPEAEMCEAVHKACPLLFSIIHSMNDNNSNNVKKKSTKIKNTGTGHSISNNGSSGRDIDDDTSTSKQHNHLYPKFLDCSLYTPGCRQNKLTARLFQSNGGGCQSPLVTTSLRRNWIPGIERCSFPCRRPHFDSDHYRLARWITGCAALFCLCTNVFTLFTIRLQLTERMEITLQLSIYVHRLIDSLHLPTFSTNRKSHLIYNGKSSKSSATTLATSLTGTKTTTTTTASNETVYNPSWRLLHTSLFYIHLFLILGCFGWLLPLLPTIGEYVACREDGSLRVGEPQISSGKSFLCIIDFILLYFSSMVAAIWSNIFDYALLYQMKKINYNLTNQLSHQQFPPKHHHRYHHYQYKNKLHRQQSQHRNHRRRQRHNHHEQQQQPSQQYHNDVEMKHFQSYITKFSENLSKKYNKSSDRSMPKRISDEPLSEITNSVNLTNEKSSEFELVNEEHFVPNNDTTTTTATDTTNKNTLDLNIDNNKNNSTTTNVYNEAIIESLNVPISKDCPSNTNMIKKECKLSCSFSSSSSSSSSSSASSSASPSSLTSSSSSLLLLSSQNVDNVEKMDDRAQLSNNNNNNNNTYTDNSFTTDKLHNPMHKFRKHKIKGLHSRDYHFGDNYHKLHSSPSSHNHSLVCLESIPQHSPGIDSICLNPYHNYHDRRHHPHQHHLHHHCRTGSHNYYQQYKFGSFTGIPLNSLVDLLSSDCIDSCFHSSSCFPISKPLISQILWIQLFTSDKYLFIHNIDTIGTVDDNTTKHGHHNEEDGNDDAADHDDKIDGHFLNTKTTANTTTTTTCSHMRSLMLNQGVIISSPINNQSINTQPQTTCLHFLALAIPLVFTLIILTAAEIDGNSLSGICSVGLINIWARVGLLLIPFTLCLIIKFYYFIQLMHQFMKLRHKFLLSSFHVDHEIAQRLVRYCLFYGIFLMFLLSLWLFSICIHTYVYLNEPVWLESQRRLFLCRIRYRLLGLDELASMNVCVNTAFSYETVDTSPSSILSSSAATMAAFTPSLNIHSNHISSTFPTKNHISIDDSFMLNNMADLQSSSTQSISDLLMMKSSDLQIHHQQQQIVKQQRQTGTSIQQNNDETASSSSLTATRMSTYLPIDNDEMISIQKPSVGPLLLHLIVYFAINLLYNSMCLLDPSVKRTWWYLLKRVIFWFQRKKRNFFHHQRQQQHPRNRHRYQHRHYHSPYSHDYSDNDNDRDIVHNNNNENENNLGILNDNDDFIKSYLNHLIIGFSWWDPGFFIIPTPILSNNDLWKKSGVFYSHEKYSKKLQDFELVKRKSNRFTDHDNNYSTTNTNTTTMISSSMLNCTDNNDGNHHRHKLVNKINHTTDHDIVDFNADNNDNNNNILEQLDHVVSPLESLLLLLQSNTSNPQHLSNLLSKLLLLSVNNNNSNGLLEQSVLNQQRNSQLSSTSSSSPPSSIHDNNNNNLETLLLFVLRQLYQLSSTSGLTGISNDNGPVKHQDNVITTSSTTNTTITNNNSSIGLSQNTNHNLTGNTMINQTTELIPTTLIRNSSNVNLTGSNHHHSNHSLSHQSDLTATLTAAAAYEQYQKQLSDLTASITQRRSRHKRLLSGRSSIRRRSQSHSLPTNGLFLPSLTTSMNVTSNRINSSLYSTESKSIEQPFTSIQTGTITTTAAASATCLPLGRRGSFNVLQAAVSMFAAAAVASTKMNNNVKSNTSNNSFNNRRRLSQSGLSGIDTFSTHHLDSSSGTASAFGGSQISSTSIRSALTSVGLSHRHHRHHHHHRRRRQNNHTRPSSTSEARLINSINNYNNSTLNNIQSNTIGLSTTTKYNNSNNNNVHSMGSRMSSLRSISCASSSGAESYNSYRLLINQAGASWRELWRTRMLLMHVLRWAENVTSFMQPNTNTTTTSNNNSSNNINSSVLNDEFSKSQISLSNHFDAPINNNIDCVKTPTTCITTTMMTVTTTTSAIVTTCSCDDFSDGSRSSPCNINQQIPVFTSKPTDGINDFNGQLIQLIMSLIGQQNQNQFVNPGIGSQSKLDIDTQLSTNPLNNLHIESPLQTVITTMTTTTTTTTISSISHFVGQTHQLTTMDPMMAAAFAAATAAATVALQQQQALRQSSPSNSTSSPAAIGAVTFGTPTSTIHNYNNDIKMSHQNVNTSNANINSQFCHNVNHPVMTHWTTGSCSLGPMQQDIYHSSSGQHLTSPAYNPSKNNDNNIPHITPIKNISPYSQTTNNWFPEMPSTSNRHHLHHRSSCDPNSLRTIHMLNNNNIDNQQMNINNNNVNYDMNTIGPYHNYFMQPNSTYRTNVSSDENHHFYQCTTAPDLLLDHEQLTTTERSRNISNPSPSCSSSQLLSRHQQQLPVNCLIDNCNHSVIRLTNSFHSPANNTVSNVSQIPMLPFSSTLSSVPNSQQSNYTLYPNTCTNPYIVTEIPLVINEQNPKQSLITSQNYILDCESNVKLLHNPSENAILTSRNNNDSDAFDSEDEIVSVNEDDGEFFEVDSDDINNNNPEHNDQHQSQQHTNLLFTHIPYIVTNQSYANNYEPMIELNANSREYFIPGFVSSTYHHHHHLTTIEPVKVTTTITTAINTRTTTHCLPSHPLSVYSNILMQSKCSTYISPDDGEISSVSQSASQVVPCASSPSSSSSSCTDPSSSSSSSSSFSKSKLSPKLNSYNDQLTPKPIVVTCAQLDHIITDPSPLSSSYSVTLSQHIDQHNDSIINVHHIKLLPLDKQSNLNETKMIDETTTM